LVLAEKLYGLRAWPIGVDDRGDIRLGGYAGRQWRRAGETTWAECVRTDRLPRLHAAPAPAGECTCGLYVLHPYRAADHIALRTFPGGFDVVGLVEAWGRVHVHAEGFRAQYAKPKAIALLGASIDSEYGRFLAGLAAAHRAELIQEPNLQALVARCLSERIGLGPSTVARLLHPGTG
jgi:hypothetical protein